MDSFHTSFVLADRPLLGAVALVACLAGGTSSQSVASQNTTGLALAVDQPRFAAGWDSGAPALPVKAVATLQLRLAEAGRPVTGFSPSHSPARPAPVAAKPAARFALAKPITPRPGPAPLALPTGTEVLPETPAAPAAAALAPAALASAAPEGIVPGISAMPPSLAPSASVPAAGLAAALPTPGIAVQAPPTASNLLPRQEPEALKLVSSPELRHFDLAAYSKTAPKPARLATSRKTAAPITARSRTTDRLIDDVVYHQTVISVGGQPGGKIPVRIGPDMKPSIKVADLLGLVSAQMDPDSQARFALASSANEYVSFAQLRRAGLEVTYNAATDSIAIGASQ